MKIYFIGIKGVGMAGLAVIAKEQGHEVIGCDRNQEFVTDKILARYKISVESGFQHTLPKGIDLVIYTAAHQGKKNPLVQTAEKSGIKVLSYGVALAELTRGKKIIAVAGTHGKTTTSAMIAKILRDAGFDPGYLIGAGAVAGFATPAHWGKGDYFVVEADEYAADPLNDQTPKFLYLHPQAAVILSLDYDHPDVFKTAKHYYNAYKKLVKRIIPGGLVVIKSDEPNAERLIKSARSKKLKVRLFSAQKIFPGLRLKVPGRHNLINASASAYLTRGLGVESALIKKSLAGFSGLERRLELKYDGKIKVYDDYAHHPTEIRASLSALRSQYKNQRIVVIFQSHTLTRTSALLKEFGKSFLNSDIVAIAPIFLSARETDKEKAGSLAHRLVEEIKHSQPAVKFFRNEQILISYLGKILTEGDILVVMGAGDIYQIIPHLIDRWRAKQNSSRYGQKIKMEG